jgi:hypothetical protein
MLCISVFGCKGFGKYKNICTVSAIYEENELAKIDKKFTPCMEYNDECMNKYIIHMEKGAYRGENSGKEKSHRHFNPNFSFYENFPRRPRNYN